MNSINKGILLISGGFDSAVAGFIMKSLGLEIIALHCSFEPLTDDTSIKKSIELCKVLNITNLYVAKIGEQLSDISSCGDRRYYFVLQKRLFLHLAERLAIDVKAKCIITGDNLGQVSSQTLPNMVSITSEITTPIFRPLLTFDKNEIIDYAKRIGTYEISKGKEMCDILGPKHPILKSKKSTAIDEERRCNIDISKIKMELILYGA